MNEKIEQTISSVEVARMIEKDHCKVLQDIRRYTRNLTEAEIGSSEFWTGSTYVDVTGRTLPCYKVTKKGCEFIAHKMTGAKGTVFTALYINRFHEMEDALAGCMTIPATQGFIAAATNDKYKARANWFAYMLDVLETELGLSGENMLHQAYEGMKHDGTDIELIKRRYMEGTGKTNFSTFEAICHDRIGAMELAEILCSNMKIVLIRRCMSQ